MNLLIINLLSVCDMCIPQIVYTSSIYIKPFKMPIENILNIGICLCLLIDDLYLRKIDC
jgi:hypothetical protein